MSKNSESKRKQNRRKKISKKLKRRKRRRLLTIAIGILIVAAVIFVGAYWLKNNVTLPDLTIRKVETTHGGDKRAVADASEDVIGDNILTVNINQFIVDIRVNTHARQVHVYRKFPDTLVVDIKDGALLFAINTKNGAYYVDDNLKIVESSKYLSRTSIPVLSGFKTGHYRTGQSLRLRPQANFDAAVRVAKILKENGMLHQISEISYLDNRNCYRIITKNNLNIEIATVSDLSEHLDYLRVLFNKRQGNENIDLKVGKNPIVRSR